MKVDRRNMLRLLSLTGAGSLLGLRPVLTPVTNECLTTEDILGPFYLPGAPETAQLAPTDAPGTILFITGTVYANDCMTPIPNALVDVWHAGDNGEYEQVDYRGKVHTDVNGQYAYQTVLPGKYLNGNYYRPRHLHYRVSLEDTLLVTQIYFEGDDSIPIDPWASDPAAEGRIIPLTGDKNDAMHGVADIYLDVDPNVIIAANEPGGVDNRAHIRHIYPNPLHQNGQVEVFIPNNGTVEFSLYDLSGRLHQQWKPESQGTGIVKYPLSANNQLGIRLPAGVYILRFSVNGQAVDAKRFFID